MIEALCIGHASYDINLPLEAYPVENIKYEIPALVEEGGGPAANAACLLAEWGVGCAFGGIAGQDAYGRQVFDGLQSAGIDLSLFKLLDSFDSTLSIILVNQLSGSRTILTRKKKGIFLDIDGELLEKINPKIMLFDGHEYEASKKAMQAHPGAISVLDAGSVREGTVSLAKVVDYAVCSERYALSFTGLTTLSSASDYEACIKKLSESARGRVAVTLGERGLIYDDCGEVRHMPAFEAKAVDTTAAGDIFHGAFTYAVLKGFEFREALRLASMAAALSVEVKGGRRSIPNLDKVLDRLKQVQ